MSKAARSELLLLPVDCAHESGHFTTRLYELVRATGHEHELSNLTDEAFPQWLNLARVPEALREELAQARPDLDLDVLRWTRFSELERYALVKLSRPGHANRGFHLLVAELFENNDRRHVAPLSSTTPP